jgi:hypothetical protein
MRRFIAISVFAFAASTVGTAAAEVSTYASLPSARLISLNSNAAPREVPATERVEGIFVAAYARTYPAVTMSHIRAFGTDKEAKVFSSIGAVGKDDSPVCMSRGDFESFGSNVELHSSYVERTGPSNPFARQSAAMMKPSRPAVVAVRMERLVRNGRRATLEITDAWVDPQTRGARLIGRSSVALALLGSGPAGLDVYAVRDGARDRSVEVIVGAPKAPEQADGDVTLRAIARTLLAQTPGSGARSDCGHLRVSLHADKSGGEMASVLSTAFLAEAPGHAQESPERDERDEQDAGDEQRVPIPIERTRFDRTVRTRALLAHVSLSQTTSEKEPVLSVAFAWAGKDQEQRF